MSNWDGMVASSAGRKGINPDLAVGIHNQENSQGNPTAVGDIYDKDGNINPIGKRAYGLMQIHPDTARGVRPQWGGLSDEQVAEKLKDPATNIEVGTDIMADIKKHGAVSDDDIASAYNGGYVLVSSHGGYVNQGYVNGVRKHMGLNAMHSGLVSSHVNTINATMNRALMIPPQKYQGLEVLKARKLAPLEIPNPYHANLELTIGDQAFNVPPLKSGSSGSLSLLDFSYLENQGGGAQWSLRLFIRSAEVVASISQVAATKGYVKLRWGYTNLPGGMRRNSAIGVILEFQPEFKDSGFEVSIQGQDQSFYSTQVVKSQAYWPESGEISDVVAYIAKLNKWDAIIERTIPLYNNQTEKQPRIWRQVNKTDLNFIVNDLKNYAISYDRMYPNSSTHLGEYTAYFDAEGVFHFHSVYPNVVRTYTWGQPGSNVKKFRPKFLPRMISAMGAAWLMSRTVDPYSGEVTETIVSGKSVNDPQIDANHPLGPGFSRRRTTPSHHPGVSQAELIQEFCSLRAMAVQADMLMMGDPHLLAGDVISVNVGRPGEKTLMFYDWQIFSNLHTISFDGSYDCSLQLLRSPFDKMINDKIDVKTTAYKVDEPSPTDNPTPEQTDGSTKTPEPKISGSGSLQ